MSFHNLTWEIFLYQIHLYQSIIKDFAIRIILNCSLLNCISFVLYSLWLAKANCFFFFSFDQIYLRPASAHILLIKNISLMVSVYWLCCCLNICFLLLKLLEKEDPSVINIATFYRKKNKFCKDSSCLYTTLSNFIYQHIKS